jgi:hypothetical protein
MTPLPSIQRAASRARHVRIIVIKKILGRIDRRRRPDGLQLADMDRSAS